MRWYCCACVKLVNLTQLILIFTIGKLFFNVLIPKNSHENHENKHVLQYTKLAFTFRIDFLSSEQILENFYL